ncbi:mammalian cell entry protein [Candidatus Mycobacterium methanotrophicum]|uniref:Mammalian cell entry protein n=1 Tax=Candidatus Mycobacterium methanotrophicum TaxID=2943498 RepID=A0ABY4QKN8_9MYCO|nr:mammalian cell entry protein [Candidatus Mycobacterium methanotrophicum]UQX10883.1 mammalian cell entry protein [Candidatus Mycobacterium methanotrophicum]
MSPRRKVQPGEAPLFVERAVAPRREWRLPLRFTVAAVVMAEAITACALVLISHESQRRAAMKDRTVIADVRSFMTEFTSPDPFHANKYVDRVLAHATGEFAKQYQQRANLVLLAVARGEPTTGTVLDAGVERWNDDGSANVLVASQVSSKSPDGKKTVDVASRWLVTAQKEGDQWKISSLVQVV